MSYKLIDERIRSRLAEGRDWGMGYSFCEKSGKKFIAAYALTCCKDFLHEEIHSEHTGKSWKKYGLGTSKKNLFNLKDNKAYMAFGILGYNKKGGRYINQDKDTSALSENLNHLQKFLNWFEEKFQIKERTKLDRFNKANRYLSTMPLFWTMHSYRISLYTFLMRVAIYWDGKQDIMTYLDDIKYSDEDKMFYKSIKPKLEMMLAGEIPNPQMTKHDNCPHEKGIIGFEFPKSKLLIEKDGIVMKKLFI